MNARITDWSLALAISAAFASGIYSLIAGRPDQWWVFALHSIAGLWLLPIVLYKLWRVRRRLLNPQLWERRTFFGAFATILALATISSGVWWTTGGVLVVAGYNLLNWHIIFGLLLTLGVSAHMLARALPLRRRELRDRRSFARLSFLALAAAAAWPAKDAIVRAANTPASRRRFTGSRQIGSYSGNGAFPYVSWMADRPRSVEITHWRLTIGGAVAHAYALSYAELAMFDDQLEATLDCTGGFYTTQRWRGAPVGALLERAAPLEEARYVSFVSITGYRWSLPLEEARQALLATGIDDGRLDHGHGAPARLVAPGRRGFEWVKWVAAIDVLREPDAGQVAAIYLSGLTPAGRGE
jgi:DMSO/TMAO reductase YedYZ molybdopterin-dependent catalytic subunit